MNISPKEIVTAGGIWLPEDEVREDLAIVLAVGDGLPIQTGEFIPFRIKPGDIVRTTRKKGRTAYLDCMGEDGVGDRQTAYSYYQWNEIIAVEYHSEYIANEIKLIEQKFPIDISWEEEKSYREKDALRRKEKREAEENNLKEKDEQTKKKRDFRDRLKREVFSEPCTEEEITEFDEE